MFALKVVIICATIAISMLFAYLERRLKLELTDEAVPPVKYVSDLGILYGLKQDLQRERYLGSLSAQAKFKYRVVVGLKFLFVAILIIEVFVLRKNKLIGLVAQVPGSKFQQ